MHDRSVLRITTPEGVVFRFHLAGPLSRFLAWTVDGAFVLAFTGGVAYLLNQLQIARLDFVKALYTVIFFIAMSGYGILFEWRWRGQTPGKKMLRLRVLDADGLHLQFHQIVLRNLIRPVDALPVFYLAGGIAALLTERAQRFGDLAAHTIVVRAPRRTIPDLERIGRGRYNSLLEHRALCAQIRQRIPSEAGALFASALLRRDELDPERRIELFDTFAAYCCGLITLPPEIIEQLSSEQIVRNMVEVLYTPAGASPTATTVP